jgi:hypothetical protein
MKSVFGGWRNGDERDMATPCHILVEGNPAMIYASRNGGPDKTLPTLQRFLQTFWQERDALGEDAETPACLVAQILVRFGFEICEDDFSNLRVGVEFNPTAAYLYEVSLDRTITVWRATAAYYQDSHLGLAGCQQLQQIALDK